MISQAQLQELESARRIHQAAFGRWCRADESERAQLTEEVAAAALRVHELEDAISSAQQDGDQ